MTSSIHIFDRHLKRHRQNRTDMSRCGFLKDWAGKQMQDRLKDIKRDFKTVIHMDSIGIYAPPPDLPPEGGGIVYVGDEETLPFKPGSLDLLTSNLRLHTVNDLPGALVQIRRALKPDGLFIGAMFGGETLYELRESLTQAELTLKGGISPRVFPFADKQQMGALLQRAGFALPVVDSDIITVTYDTMFDLMHDLRGMGESNIITARDKRYPGKALFFDAARHYAAHFSEADGRIKASFEIIFLAGWAPHVSQQQPLKPGSAETHLTEVL